MKIKVFLTITIINGKAEVNQISEKYFNDFNLSSTCPVLVQ